jgi:aryl-alcohol dehydrogenase-like predicted oxidoreductase
MDDRTDERYTEAVRAAVRGGVNFIDTSLNYRHQRSERAIGAAVSKLVGSGGFSREELIVCTKAGYLVPDAQPFLHFYDVVGGMHCLTPGFLADQLDRSRRNLGLETIDVFYLHNPETQLGPLPRELFDQRIKSAFEAMEQMAADGRIRFYGTATWDGYRKGDGSGLSLPRIAALAKEVAGNDHHFRFVQLPYNLAMPEANVLRNVTVDDRQLTILAAAQELGITVIASASLLQARLTRNLPAEAAGLFPGARTNAQRALQFSRSAPGIAVALVGMSNADHVEDNLGISDVRPLNAEEYARFFQSA